MKKWHRLPPGTPAHAATVRPPYAQAADAVNAVCLGPEVYEMTYSLSGLPKERCSNYHQPEFSQFGPITFRAAIEQHQLRNCTLDFSTLSIDLSSKVAYNYYIERRGHQMQAMTGRDSDPVVRSNSGISIFKEEPKRVMKKQTTTPETTPEAETVVTQEAGQAPTPEQMQEGDRIELLKCRAEADYGRVAGGERVVGSAVRDQRVQGSRGQLPR